MDNEKIKDSLEFKGTGTEFYSAADSGSFGTHPVAPPENKSLLHKIMDAVNNIFLGVLTAVVITVALFSLWQVLFSNSVTARLGDMAMVALSSACIFFFRSVLIVIAGFAVWFCLLPIIFRKKETLRFIVTVVSVVIMGIVGYIVHRFALMGYALPEEIVARSLALSSGIGAAFPLFFGSLVFFGYDRPLTKAVLLQLGMGVVFYALTVALGTYVTVSLNMACTGITMANMTSAIIVFAVSVFTSKGFRKLVLRKR